MHKIILILCIGLAASESNITEQTKQTKTPNAKTTAKSERHFGFVESFEKANGAWQLKINYAEFLEGDAAEQAAKADNAGYSPAELSGIYIRDKNPLVRSLKVSDSAAIFLLRDLEPSKITLVNFAKLMRGESADLPRYWGFPYNRAKDYCLPVYVTLEDGVVARIRQQYLP